MLEKQKLIKGDNTGINKVIDLIIDVVEEDHQLAAGINNPDKNLENAWNYIMFRARKELDGKSGYVDEATVLGWTIHYFIESKKAIDEEMGLNKKVEKQEVKKAEIKKTVKQIKPKSDTYGQLSMFDILGDQQ